MGIQLLSADIVVLASTHNPSIMSPEWLKNKGLLAENPTNFVHTLDFSLFESRSYRLTLDRFRLQIMATQPGKDEGSLKTVSRIASTYISSLPELPYTALGLNFEWSMSSDTELTTPKMELRLDSDKDWETILYGHTLTFGGIVYARKEPYILSLTITPRENGVLIYNFNYHHELAGMSPDAILNYIAEFTNLYHHSLKVVRSTAH